jgi:hypothetical protein
MAEASVVNAIVRIIVPPIDPLVRRGLDAPIGELIAGLIEFAFARGAHPALRG